MKISREELYRRVWESPVTRLAAEFDISDVGLSKACRAHAIPLPPRGYWTKLQHGKSVVKPPLPPSATNDVVIDAPRHRLPSPIKRTKPEVPDGVRVLVEPLEGNRKLSHYAERTRQHLRGLKTSSAVLSTSDKSQFDCRVSKAAIDAACQLLDALERVAPAFGGEFKPGEKSVEFVYQSQAVVFRLTEQYTTVEQYVPGKKYASWERPDVSYDFTGKFTLEIPGYFEGRKKWADGKRQRLTDLLGEFMQGLVDAAKALKQRRLDMEEQQRRWRVEAEQRAERERREKDLLDFRSKLLAEAQARREHALLRAHVDELRELLSEFVGPLPQSSLQWLKTAGLLVSAEDPLEARKRLLTSGIQMGYYTGSFGGTA